MCLTNLGQLGNPCERAMTNCASDNLVLSDNFACAKLATSRIQPSVRTGSCGVISMPDRSTGPLTQFVDQLRTASGSVDLVARTSSFASFLYCSRLGRGGRGRASCGLGNMRISFHRMPGVRTNQAERRSVPSVVSQWVGTALSADWMRPLRW